MRSGDNELVEGRHFGVPVRQGSIHELRVNRATYTNVSRTVSNPLIYRYAIEERHLSPEEAAEISLDPATCREYGESYAQTLVERALHNFDFNMMYFERLEEDRFQQGAEGLLSTFPELEPVTDLGPWVDKQGVYMMVLDSHRQLYFGQSIHIGKCIRQHWTSSKRLDRLVYGKVEESILSIDSFRALDTTRIYARSRGLDTKEKRDAFEAQIVKQIDPGLALNRIDGGHIYDAVESERENGVKVRDLIATEEELAVYWAKLDATPMGREVHQRGYRRRRTTRKKVSQLVRMPEGSDPIRHLVAEANRRKRTTTILVDAAGTIIEVCEDSAPRGASGHIQLFQIPCGMSISRDKMETALRLVPESVDASIQPPIPLFQKLGSSTVSVRRT